MSLETYPITQTTQVDNTSIELDSNNKVSIKDSGVTTAKINDGDVTTAKIKDLNVTSDKMSYGMKLLHTGTFSGSTKIQISGISFKQHMLILLKVNKDGGSADNYVNMTFNDVTTNSYWYHKISGATLSVNTSQANIPVYNATTQGHDEVFPVIVELSPTGTYHQPMKVFCGNEQRTASGTLERFMGGVASLGNQAISSIEFSTSSAITGEYAIYYFEETD